MSELKPRPPFAVDGKYNTYGRWPRDAHHYEEGALIGSQESRVAVLSDLLRSPIAEDRVRAMIYIESLRVTVPAFVVIEALDSPNLNREGIAKDLRLANRTEWSAHVDEAEAELWRAEFQRLSDAQIARHPWWGENSRRIFTVEYRENAGINGLRMPGADPKTCISAFT